MFPIGGSPQHRSLGQSLRQRGAFQPKARTPNGTIAKHGRFSTRTWGMGTDWEMQPPSGHWNVCQWRKDDKPWDLGVPDFQTNPNRGQELGVFFRKRQGVGSTYLDHGSTRRGVEAKRHPVVGSWIAEADDLLTVIFWVLSCRLNRAEPRSLGMRQCLLWKKPAKIGTEPLNAIDISQKVRVQGITSGFVWKDGTTLTFPPFAHSPFLSNCPLIHQTFDQLLRSWVKPWVKPRELA